LAEVAAAMWRFASVTLGRSSKGVGGWRGAGSDGDEGSSATEEGYEEVVAVGNGDDSDAGVDGQAEDGDEVDEVDEEETHSLFPPSSAAAASMGMPCGRADFAVGRYDALDASWSTEGGTS